MATYVKVATLPHHVRNALASLGYRRHDVAINAAEATRPHGAYGDGYRAAMTVVNMATGERQTIHGSWGGANPFTPQVVDHAAEDFSLPDNACVIHSQEGGGRPVSASIVVRPEAFAPMLPAAPTATDAEKTYLRVIRGYKPGYRAAELQRAGIDVAATLAALLGKGWVKQSASGAVSITTEGKNVQTR